MSRGPLYGRSFLTKLARQDVRDILRWSEEQFGKDAALRYQDLLIQALRDVEADPERVGSKARLELAVADVRTYHLTFSRFRVSGPSVRNPRHFLLYRMKTSGVIEIGRVLHDRFDLVQHLPEGYSRLKSD